MSAVTPDLDREQLAALVYATLDRHGTQVVLSSGGAAAIYAPNPYESMDLDFIPIGLSRRVGAAMRELGFGKERGRHWTHPDTAFWVEFPPGPVQVGDEVVHEFAERRTAHGTLRILTPTDCVMDRLAWYFHANDEQALAVAAAHEIDLDRIEAWSRRERAVEKLERASAACRGRSDGSNVDPLRNRPKRQPKNQAVVVEAPGTEPGSPFPREPVFTRR